MTIAQPIITRMAGVLAIWSVVALAVVLSGPAFAG